MLVLSRKPDESIFIGDDIVITIVATKGCQVRIGIDAPKNVPILREEILNDHQIANLKDPAKTHKGASCKQ